MPEVEVKVLAVLTLSYTIRVHVLALVWVVVAHRQGEVDVWKTPSSSDWLHNH